MAENLVSFFDKAKKMGGMKAQMRLSLLTKMSIVKAKAAEDNSENKKKFEEAITELKKEFG
ncbi:MAG: hypothetical protein KAI79_03730 [Bacteroidales bacterium]|nr:hypothetical protein [Bacteroidales bacterium]